ncbi:hypothetical protein AG1IA_09297 [Rhizoctonia solani AG-1 IA]|uniref:Uncharacterized protein n=1 Tax=Thanatephorus cucumeris (strain AG1-IA) TaxID=983506 RepID=L8WEQ4_THACA|nr:hypothetical protein AG1IA_09297 [Rhizoctonia solani AG-1 IA]
MRIYPTLKRDSTAWLVARAESRQEVIRQDIYQSHVVSDLHMTHVVLSTTHVDSYDFRPFWSAHHSWVSLTTRPASLPCVSMLDIKLRSLSQHLCPASALCPDPEAADLKALINLYMTTNDPKWTPDVQLESIGSGHLWLSRNFEICVHLLNGQTRTCRPSCLPCNSHLDLDNPMCEFSIFASGPSLPLGPICPVPPISLSSTSVVHPVQLSEWIGYAALNVTKPVEWYLGTNGMYDDREDAYSCEPHDSGCAGPRHSVYQGIS